MWTHILSDLVEYDIYMLRPTNKHICKISNPKFKKPVGTGVMTMNYFAKIGATSCMQYCHDLGAKWEASTFVAAASKGQIATIDFLDENDCDYDSQACSAAAANGHLECLKHLQKNDFPWDAESTISAAGADHLEILIYLHENGCEVSSHTIVSAARYSTRCLEYLFSKECHKVSDNFHYQNRLCGYAAGAGNLACLKFLFENGFQLGNSCESAAFGGHLECLKFAHEKGGAWGDVVAAAAQAGSVPCLKYAIESLNNTPYLAHYWREPLDAAVGANSIECVK